MIDNNICIVLGILVVIFLIYNLNKSSLTSQDNNIRLTDSAFAYNTNTNTNTNTNETFNQESKINKTEHFEPNNYNSYSERQENVNIEHFESDNFNMYNNSIEQNQENSELESNNNLIEQKQENFVADNYNNKINMQHKKKALSPVSTAKIMSTNPDIAIPNKEINIPTNLNLQYDYNLKGNINNNINPDITNTHQAADFGESYNLGVYVTDHQFKKYMVQAPPEKPKIISDDLLPKQNEDWFETPLIGTKVDDANLLADAIFKVGVDTVGQTRKNPAYDIRGTIANPKFAVSPWNNSSWEPDNNLKSLC